MQTLTTPVQIRKVPLADQLILALIAGIFLFFLVAGGGVIGFEIAHSGKIFPGISVGAVDLSGLTPAEATARVDDDFTYPQTGQIFLQDGKDAWQVTPADIGLIPGSRDLGHPGLSDRP